MFNGSSHPILINCIFWGDIPEEINLGYKSTTSITYSDIQGGWDGEGNIDTDPCFVEPGYWDADGVWVEGDYHLLMDSVCINAGDPNYVAGPNETDLDGKARVLCGRIDMGAYEFQGSWYWYVDDDASNDPGPGNPDVSDPMEDGTPAHPFDAIQEAIDATRCGDTVIVLGGTYTGTGNRDIDFNGKPITVRSENGPENCIIDCQGTYEDSHRAFIFQSGEHADSVLDGFTITNGNVFGRDWRNYCGAGIYCGHESSPTIRNNTISGNRAHDGGGIYCSGSPTITDNIITENTAVDGGGIYCYERGTIANNTITKNTAERGGGIFTWEDYAPTIINNIIAENWAEQEGGGIGIHDNSPTIIGNLIIGNATAGNGGGIYLQSAWSEVTNNTITGNTAVSGGGICCFIGLTTMRNCIVWGNAAVNGREVALHTHSYTGVSVLTVSYSDIAGGQAEAYVEEGSTLNWGEGNIDVEPQFADSNNGNYRLSAGSPCIDAGDNDSVPPDVCDLDGKARIYDGDGDGEAVVDMGAYELGLPPIEVPMKLVPQALNPGSQGNWVKAHFVLPEGYTVDDVDTNRSAEIEQFQITSESMEVFVNEEDFVVVMAVFDRKAFCSIGPLEGEIAVVGYLTSGRRFRGTDIIKILTNKIKHLGVLAANWLSVCSAPDWCDGADLDQDSVVNFIDFALLDGCCFEVIKD